jgi:hypothetical protein
MNVSNKLSVSELKQKYLAERAQDGVGLENIRIFCLGKELKDDLFLYSYEIADGIVMQAMIKK